MQKYIKDIGIFFISSLSLILISTILTQTNYDSIWNYGFSYNMAMGKIPYRDFNMIVGPFYNLIFAPFISLFGNYLIVYYIVNSFIFSFFIVLIARKINNNFIYIIMLISMVPATFTYNTFVAFLLILILIIYDSSFKYKEELISLIVGLIMITKQNIGFIMLITNFLVTNNKIKNMIISIIPMIFLCIYLAINNALYEYIDFCYLGLGKFTENFYYTKKVIILLPLILLWLIKKYIDTRDSKILFILAFQVINFPLIDEPHFIVSLIPVVYYYFLISCSKYFFFVKEILLIATIGEIIRYGSFNYSNSHSYIFLTNISPVAEEYLNNTNKYIKKYNGYDTFIFSSNAYFIRLSQNKTLSFYDLTNKGNLGSNPEKYLKILDNKCSESKCLFIISHEYSENENQLDDIFRVHIEKKYYYKEELPSNDKVYTNISEN